MSSSTMDTEELARLALGGRALKNRRVRRAIIARLINENGESYEGDEGEEGEEEEASVGGEDRELLRVQVGSRLFKRRRTRRALLAHLLRSKGEYESEGDEEESGEEESEGGGEDRELVRAVIASKMLRRRKVRRAILAHILRSKAEEMEGESDEEGEEEGGGGDDRELVRALIASKMLRRRKVRRALLAHLLRSKAESMSEGDEGEEDYSDEGGREDRELLRAVIASKMLRRRRVRKALLTHLLGEKEEAVA